MAQSLSAIYLHIIFSTKDRQPLLGPEIIHEVHAYMGGILNSVDCVPISIGGVADHVHILARHSRTLAASDVIARVKRESTLFAKSKGAQDFEWQKGFAVYSVGSSQVHDVRRYIETQEQHHRRISFQDELRQILTSNDMRFDEKYIWS